MNFSPHGISVGKVVYWINGQRFENTSKTETFYDGEGKKHTKTTSLKDGKQKAEQYCLDNFLNPADIQKFDSRTECDRYEDLLKQQEQGLISNLGHHFTLRIQEEYVNCNGDTIPAITYEADFIYKDLQKGIRVVEDVKGSEYFIDERFITLKQVFDKLMKDKGLYIKVMLLREHQFVEWHIGEKKKSQKLIKKQREAIKQQKAELHQKEMEQNKVNRDIESYKRFILIDKPNSAQRKRIAELKEKLTQKGIIL